MLQVMQQSVESCQFSLRFLCSLTCQLTVQAYPGHYCTRHGKLIDLNLAFNELKSLPEEVCHDITSPAEKLLRPVCVRRVPD